MMIALVNSVAYYKLPQQYCCYSLQPQTVTSKHATAIHKRDNGLCGYRREQIKD